MIQLKGIAGWGGGILLLLLISACGDIGGSGQCGGVASAGSCIRIESITPTYLDVNTSNVDARRNTCVKPPPAAPDAEPFTDHDEIITISNSPLPGAPVDTIHPVTLLDFSITYTLNRCPSGICPSLNSLNVLPGQTTVIPPNDSVSFQLPFAPLALKKEYLDKGGSVNTFPSYTANYLITGTDSFRNPISIQGAAEFTIGDFNNCPSGSTPTFP